MSASKQNPCQAQVIWLVLLTLDILDNRTFQAPERENAWLRVPGPECRYSKVRLVLCLCSCLLLGIGFRRKLAEEGRELVYSLVLFPQGLQEPVERGYPVAQERLTSSNWRL